METRNMTKLGPNHGRALKGCALLALASGFALATPAQAVTQGSIGATSTGAVSITASVPNRASITSLSDITFASVDPASAATSTQGPCVWSNTATRKYTIKATGSGTASAFSLTDGTVIVPYSVGWAATAGASSFSALTSGTASAALTATATTVGCSAGVDSTLQVSIGATDLQTMVATNSYTGTLTLVVTPQ
jgi:hypothetical protein